MRPPSLVLDLIFAAIVGLCSYAALVALWPATRGPGGGVAAFLLAFIVVALRRPGGSLGDRADAYLPGKRTWTLDRVLTADLNAPDPPLLIKILMAAIAGLVAVAVLALVLQLAWGIDLPEWTARVVLAAVFLLWLVPDLRRRWLTGG